MLSRAFTAEYIFRTHGLLPPGETDARGILPESRSRQTLVILNLPMMCYPRRTSDNSKAINHIQVKFYPAPLAIESPAPLHTWEGIDRRVARNLF